MSFQADLRDIRFVLFDLLGLDELLGTEPFAELDHDTVVQMLVEGEKFARERLAPLNAVADRVGCQFVDGQVTVPPGFTDAYRAYCELGFLASEAPGEEGGMGLPHAVGLALDELFITANAAFSNYPGLSRACGNMLRQWGSPEQLQRWLPPLVSGRWQGTMCLTEAAAGSFVGACRTIARPTADGRWLLSGQKTFITAPNLDMVDNVVHMVLARTPDAPIGIKGISLFLVPQRAVDAAGEPGADNDVRIIGIEEKMGIHGSVTTTLSFGEDGRCEAELVGPLHEGIRVMFSIMNEERVQVGMQGEAVGAGAYLNALAYAKERVQGIPLTSRSRDPKDQVTLVQHPDVRRMLLTMKGYVEGSRALILLTGMYIDRARAATDPAIKASCEGWVELLTPLCKAYCSDVGFEVTVLAMQVFGGSGYIRETGAEQAVRDSRIATIYEGTNGIQAQDLLFRKALMSKGALIAAWNREIEAFVAEHGQDPELATAVGQLDAARQTMGRVVTHLGGRIAAGDVDFAGQHATGFLRLSGNLMIAWLLLRSAVVANRKLADLELPGDPLARTARLADDPTAAHLAAKGPVARFFAAQLLSANQGLATAMFDDDRSVLEAVL